MPTMVPVASAGHKPKLLDQRVKALLTRQGTCKSFRSRAMSDVQLMHYVCAPLAKRQRILHWLLG